MSEYNDDNGGDDETGINIDSGVDAISEQLGFAEDDNDSTTNDSDGDDLGTDSDDSNTVDDGKSDDEDAVSDDPAPASWAKDKHETWAKLPKEAKEYISLREKQVADGFEQYKNGYKWGESLNKTFEPFRDLLDAAGVDEQTAVTNLLSHQRNLTQGSLDQRQQAFVNLGQNLGLIPAEGQAQIDPVTMQLQDRLNAIEARDRQYQQQIQQREYQTVASDVETFASDPKNVYFNDVIDDIIPLLNAGYDLNTAYEKAVWANPISRVKEQDRIYAERAIERKKEALAAKKASSSNIRPNNRNSVQPQELIHNNFQQTMQDTLNEIKARS